MKYKLLPKYLNGEQMSNRYVKGPIDEWKIAKTVKKGSKPLPETSAATSMRVMSENIQSAVYRRRHKLKY